MKDPKASKAKKSGQSTHIACFSFFNLEIGKLTCTVSICGYWEVELIHKWPITSSLLGSKPLRGLASPIPVIEWRSFSPSPNAYPLQKTRPICGWLITSKRKIFFAPNGLVVSGPLTFQEKFKPRFCMKHAHEASFFKSKPECSSQLMGHGTSQQHTGWLVGNCTLEWLNTRCYQQSDLGKTLAPPCSAKPICRHQVDSNTSQVPTHRPTKASPKFEVERRNFKFPNPQNNGLTF